MTAPTGTRPAYRDPNALRWVVGYLASLVGDQVWFVALGWAAVQAGTPTQVGLVLAAGTLPRAVLLLVGGALADRWGPRRAALGSDAVRTVVLVLAAVLALTLPPSVTVLLLLAAGFGVVDAVFLPATAAMPQQLVEPGQTVRLQGMRATAQRAATMLGAPLGGLAVAAGGSGTGFGLAAALTAVGAVALLLTRVRPREPVVRAPLLGEVRVGLAYAVRHPVLRPLLVLAAVVELGFTGAVNLGLPVLSNDRGWGAGGVGLMLGAFGVGATVAAVGLVSVRRVPHVGWWLLPVTLTMALALIAIGLSPTLPLAVASCALVGAGAGLAGSLAGSLVLTSSSPELVARVSSLLLLASLGLSPLALLAAGGLASAGGAATPFIVGGAVAALGVPVLLASPALRRAELPD